MFAPKYLIPFFFFLALASEALAQIELLNTASIRRGVRQSTFTIEDFDPRAVSDKLVVAVNAEGRGAIRTINSITFGNRNLTFAHSGSAFNAPSRRSEIWFLDNPGTTPATITIQWSGQTNGCMAGAYSLRNTRPGQPSIREDDNERDIQVNVNVPSFMIASYVDDDEGSVSVSFDSPYDLLVGGSTRSAKGGIASSFVSQPGITDASFFASNRTNAESITIVGIRWNGTPPTVVTTLEDQLDTPAGSELSLREAIRDSLVSGTIQFAPELNGGTIQLDASLGPLRITDTLTIDASALPAGIIIDGGSNGDFVRDANETQCLIVDSPRGLRSVRFENLTIQNGVSDQANGGGNILSRELLTLTDCRILNGRAFSDTLAVPGGGISNIGGALNFTRCEISGNQTSGTDSPGGGIFSDATTLNRTNSLIDCIVANNQTFGPNSRGGGIFGQASAARSFALTRCTVAGNETFGDGSGGGGIAVSSTDINLTACTISNNQTHGADSDGGGILRVSNNFFITSTFTQSTITGNAALQSQAGALFASGATIIIDHCSIVDNTAAPGETAGIVSVENRTTTEIKNSIVRNSSGELDLLREENSNPFREEVIYQFSGTNIIGSIGPDIENITINTEPLLLAPLANYGGPTETIPPLPGSPATDAATDSLITEDQRGFPIIGTPDIGAAEQLPITMQISLVENRLVISEIDGPFENRLEISTEDGNYRISDTSGLLLDANSISGASGSITSTVIIPRGTIDQLEVSTLAGNDTVDILSLPGALQGGVSIDGGDDLDSITIAGLLDTGATGDLFLSAETITQTEGIRSGGQASLVGETITLESSENDFGIFNLTANTASIVEANTITLDQVTNTGGFTLETLSGDILDTPEASITVAGAASFAAAQNIRLDHFDEHILEGLVTLSAERVINFATIQNITFGKITVRGTSNSRNTIQSGNGTVTLTDDVTTAGSSDLQIRIRGNVVQQGGRIRTDTLAVIAISPNIQADLPGENDVREFVSDTRIGDPRLGDILFNDINDVQLSTIRSDRFTLTAGGSVRSVGRMFIRGASTISLIGDLTFENAIELSDTLSLEVTGTTTISPSATLEVLDTGESIPSFTKSFAVIRKNGTSPILGTLQNLPEGAEVATPSGLFQIRYRGGDGNDITLDVDFLSDLDNDGLSFILERAFGTDPDLADFSAAQRPSLGQSENRDIAFTFGRGSEFLSGTVLLVERSSTLAEGSFEEIYRFEFGRGFSTIGDGITANEQDTEITITDTAKFKTAFYRVRAILVE